MKTHRHDLAMQALHQQQGTNPDDSASAEPIQVMDQVMEVEDQPMVTSEAVTEGISLTQSTADNEQATSAQAIIQVFKITMHQKS